MRLLVCGSRTFTNPLPVESFLWGLAHERHVAVLIHGSARGADLVAARAAQILHIEVQAYPADWNKHGKAAGVIRNQQMLDEGKPDLVVAFVDKPLAESRGTAHMVKIARAAGLPVYVVEKM